MNNLSDTEAPGEKSAGALAKTGGRGFSHTPNRVREGKIKVSAKRCEWEQNVRNRPPFLSNYSAVGDFVRASVAVGGECA